MKTFRSCWSRWLAGAGLALAAIASAAGLQAQVAPPPAPAVAPLVALPPVGDPNDTVRLQCNDMPLSSLLSLLEDLTGRFVIRPQSLPTPLFAFDSRGPISKRDAIIAIESLLTINGIAVAPMGEKFIKIVPVGNVRTEAPELVVGSLRERPPTGLIVSKLFRLEYLDTAAFQAQVQPFLGTGAPVVPFQNSNTVLVTDTISNLQRLEYVLDQVDKPRNLVTKFYTLKFAQAQAVAEKIKSLIETTKSAFNRQPGTPAGAPGGGAAAAPGMPAMPAGGDVSAGLGAALLSATTSLNFDERTNQVILVSDPSSVQFFDNLIEKLDVQAAPNTKIEVIQIQHAQATDIAAVLSSFISGTTGGGGSSVRRSPATASTSGSTSRTARQNTRGAQTRNRDTFPGLRQSVALPNQAISSAANSAAGGERVSQFSDFMTIIPDERSNAIVVSGTQDDLNLIRDLIRQIDVVLPQVQIDVLIAGVTLSNDIQRGIDAFTGISVVGSKVVALKSITGPGLGLNDLKVNRSADLTTFDFTGLLQTVNSRRNVRVLSVPTITTTHNQEATVNISESQPIITGSQTDISNSTALRSSYTYQDIGLQLTVKPLIGLDGTIQMEIDQSADEPNGSVTIDGNTQPLISRREAKSFVTVQDGEIIVLGGLQKESVQKGAKGFPIISEIPLLGRLFGTTSRSKNREEVLFFIQPRILRTTGQADAVARAQLDKSGVRDLVQPYLVPSAPKPAAPKAAEPPSP